jgi:FkbM family methyltransferase
MSLNQKIWRIKQGIKRRGYRFHPKSFYWDYCCHHNSDKPLIAKFDKNLKARVWPGDVIGRGLYVTSRHEQQEVNFLKHVLKPGIVFFDIGANMGFYSLIASKRVGANGQVHSFEPNPRMFKELKYNVNLNGLNNVKLNRLALSDKPGIAQLSRYERGKEVYGSLSQNIYPGAKVIGYDDVAVDTIDKYNKKEEINRVDVIKVDVEGAEFLVFKGAKALLSSSNGPVILFEMSQSFLDGFNTTCREVAKHLMNFNYKIFIFSFGKYMQVSGNYCFNENFPTSFIAIKSIHQIGVL